ncbi:Dihydropyrimidinase-related protein 5 [Galemys pyrenaicus]|uniref:Dihydropyrimidinase-related protein 5 n=1 Tax=Galemys pyrenaicus TaxID=202257 RepID=A0A8J6DVS0_GALPY|nr:Dihydropyrimidinase-related protein 5 [Galemys pyrenaicus]
MDHLMSGLIRNQRGGRRPGGTCRNMLANSASVRILIKGGKVVNDDCTHEADVYIENGIIQQVGRELMIPGGAKVIDATGKLVIPGGIDTSTHFHQTFMNATCVDDFYHGTKGSETPSCLCQGRVATEPASLSFTVSANGHLSWRSAYREDRSCPEESLASTGSAQGLFTGSGILARHGPPRWRVLTPTPPHYRGPDPVAEP